VQSAKNPVESSGVARDQLSFTYGQYVTVYGRGGLYVKPASSECHVIITDDGTEKHAVETIKPGAEQEPSVELLLRFHEGRHTSTEEFSCYHEAAKKHLDESHDGKPIGWYVDRQGSYKWLYEKGDPSGSGVRSSSLSSETQGSCPNGADDDEEPGPEAEMEPVLVSYFRAWAIALLKGVPVPDGYPDYVEPISDETAQEFAARLAVATEADSAFEAAVESVGSWEWDWWVMYTGPSSALTGALGRDLAAYIAAKPAEPLVPQSAAVEPTGRHRNEFATMHDVDMTPSDVEAELRHLRATASVMATVNGGDGISWKEWPYTGLVGSDDEDPTVTPEEAIVILDRRLVIDASVWASAKRTAHSMDEADNSWISCRWRPAELRRDTLDDFVRRTTEKETNLVPWDNLRIFVMRALGGLEAFEAHVRQTIITALESLKDPEAARRDLTELVRAFLSGNRVLRAFERGAVLNRADGMGLSTEDAERIIDAICLQYGAVSEQGSGVLGESGAELGPTVELFVEARDKLVFAMELIGSPLVSDVRIINKGTESLRGAAFAIRLEPELSPEALFPIPEVPVGGEVRLGALDLHLSPGRIRQVLETEVATLACTIRVGASTVARRAVSVRVMAYNEWPGLDGPNGLLASFVLPNHPAIGTFLKHVSARLSNSTNDGALAGYQTRSRDRVIAMVAALYEELQEWGITYISVPASFERHGQKIRLPGAVLVERMGCCLDLTVFYAACMEQMGLNPFVTLVEGHAFPGVWLIDECLPEGIIEDAVRLRAQVQLGNLIFFDATVGTHSARYSIFSAIEHANRLLLNDTAFHWALDIRVLRDHFRPLPVRDSTR